MLAETKIYAAINSADELSQHLSLILTPQSASEQINKLSQGAFKIGEKYLRTNIKNGKLKALRIGNDYVIPRSAFLEFLYSFEFKPEPNISATQKFNADYLDMNIDAKIDEAFG